MQPFYHKMGDDWKAFTKSYKGFREALQTLMLNRGMTLHESNEAMAPLYELMEGNGELRDIVMSLRTEDEMVLRNVFTDEPV